MMGASFAPVAGPLAALFAANMVTNALAGDKTISNSGAWKAVSSIPIIGVLPGIINALFGRGPLKQKETSLTGSLGLEGFESGMLQTHFKAKGGLFRSNKNDFARVDAVTGDVWTDNQKQLGSYAEGLASAGQKIFGMFNDTAKQTSGILRQLGGDLGFNVDVLKDFHYQINLISEKGKSLTEEQITEEIQKLSDAMVTKLVPAIDDLAKSGETAIQTFVRLSAEFNGLVSGAALVFGKSYQDAKSMISSISFGDRSAFINKAGGLDAFNSMVSGFAQNFLTQEQQLAPVSQMLSEKAGALGLGGITNRQQYLSAIQSGTLNQEQLLFLLQNQGSINQVFGLGEQKDAVKVAEEQQKAAIKAAEEQQKKAAWYAQLQKTAEESMAKQDEKRRSADIKAQAIADIEAWRAQAMHQAAVAESNEKINKLTSAMNALSNAANNLNEAIMRSAGMTQEQARSQLMYGAAASPLSEAAIDTLTNVDSSKYSNILDFRRAKAQNIAAMQTAKANTDTDIADIKEVLQELTATIGALTVSSNKSKRIFEKWDGQGLPAERSA
jgi:hypothetical protein